MNVFSQGYLKQSSADTKAYVQMLSEDAITDIPTINGQIITPLEAERVLQAYNRFLSNTYK